MNKVNKFVFDDIVSPFHFLAAISSALYSCRPGAVVYMNLQRNLSGEFVRPESRLEIGGLTFVVKHGNGPDVAEWATAKLVARFLVFIVSRLLFIRRSEVCVGHHTYFKPTLLLRLTFSECFGCRVLAFEEGIGTYGGAIHHYRAGRREGKRWPLIKFFLRKALSCPLFVTTRWAMLKGCDREFLRSAIRLVRQSYYGREERIWGANNSSKWVGANVRGKTYILFGSPLIEVYGMCPIEYSATLRTFSGAITRGGDRVLVKPHPLETSLYVYAENALELAPDDIPGEVLIDMVNPCAVVGLNSGVLIISAAIFGIPSYTVSHLLAPAWQAKIQVDGAIKELFDANTSSLAPTLCLREVVT